MAEAGTIKVGDTVTHPFWPKGETAKVIELGSMVARARYGKNRRPVKPIPADIENWAKLDRSFPAWDPANGATPANVEMDDTWMEVGLEVVT